MKKSLMFASAVVAMAFAVSFSSCGTKGCMNINDDKYDAEATISDETACDAAATTAKFVSSYNVAEACGGNNDTYVGNIVASNSKDYAIVINNFYGTGLSVSADVSSDKVTIPNQVVSGITISGNGTLVSNVLTLNYTVSGIAGSQTCIATWTKQ